MKIAITGSNGYIGSTLVQKLKNSNHDILQIDIDDWDIRTTPIKNGPKFKLEFGPRREGDNESSEVPHMSKFMNPKKTLRDIVKI